MSDSSNCYACGARSDAECRCARYRFGPARDGVVDYTPEVMAARDGVAETIRMLRSDLDATTMAVAADVVAERDALARWKAAAEAALAEAAVRVYSSAADWILQRIEHHLAG